MMIIYYHHCNFIGFLLKVGPFIMSANDSEMMNYRRVSAGYLILFFLLIGGLCQTPWAKDKAPAADPIELKLTLDKAAYRPGEAVLATVEVSNKTRGALKAYKLNAKSVVLVFGKEDDPERMERRVVVSELETLDLYTSLEPGVAQKRTFLVTRLTEFAGPMAVQAHYIAGGEVAAKAGPKIYSNAAAYKVEGKRALRRDPEGFIVKDEALRLALAAAKGGEAGDAQAIFVRDEAGFYKWYVNVKPKGGGETAAWFIDPYKGSVWHKAKPFDPKLAADPRFARPGNLPPLKVPSLVTQGGK